MADRCEHCGNRMGSSTVHADDCPTQAGAAAEGLRLCADALNENKIPFDEGPHDGIWKLAGKLEDERALCDRVARAAIAFCEDIEEDSPAISQVGLEQLHKALDFYEKQRDGSGGRIAREKYDQLIDPLRRRARELGYAIGVHGSLLRDIDLIACPWSTAAVDAPTLAEELRLVAMDVTGAAFMTPVEAADEFHQKGCPGMKPHGRLVWTFHLGGGPYIDLSVMPRSENEL